jgi:hypothetical protein
MNGNNEFLNRKIDSILKVDQSIRKGKSARNSRYAAKFHYKGKGNNTSRRYRKSKIALDKWKKTDSLNTFFLLKLFDKYGFLGEELVGYKNYNSVITILLHFDFDTTNKILEPYLEIARKEGKIQLNHFAIIQDRHLGGKYNIQKYWMWGYVDKEKLKFSESDIPNIIKLRESIGIYDLKIKQVPYKGIYSIFSGPLWELKNYY